jgi:shikimate dehydrogenase
MYPNNGESLVDLSRLPGLRCVLDLIYNPSYTKLLLDARALGLRCENGLSMLVAQAAAATERFLGCRVDADIIASVIAEVQSSKQNIVLIGMPGCGKTTVGNLLSGRLDRPLLDTDEAITRRVGSISDYIMTHGEEAFRKLEAEVIRDEIAPESGAIIATGGGAILRDENVRRLKRNGTLVFLDRPLSALMATPDRPLSSDPDALRRRYEERYDRYCAVADVHLVVPDGESAEETVERVRETF